MAEIITLLPLAALRESPFNPRKHYPEHELQELADSIASQGVMQPIVVRPLSEKQRDLEHEYEIVFGHRRYRAAQLAELGTIPAIVRALSDREAAIAQTHENAKRADVSPFEEADAFAHLMQAHGLTSDQVAAEVGKSRSYVYGRLKLHNAAPAVRQAFAEQGLSAEICLELARIPNHKIQAEALKRCKGYSNEWLSTREAKSVLKSRYIFNLTDASFDLGDAQLVPSAGACHSCPRMSLNDPDLASEPGTFCLDQACYDSKRAAHHELDLKVLEQDGHTVLRGDEAKAFMPDSWRAPNGYSSSLHVWRGQVSHSVDQLLKQAAEQGIQPPKFTYVDRGPEASVARLAKTTEWLAFLGQLFPKSEEDDDAGDASATPAGEDRLADWTPAERITLEHGPWLRVQRAAILGLRTRARTAQDLRLVLHEIVDMQDDFGDAGTWLGIHTDESDSDEIHAWVEQASPDELAVALVATHLEHALDPGYSHHRPRATRVVALAESYGVDVLAIAATEAPAAQANATEEVEP